MRPLGFFFMVSIHDILIQNNLKGTEKANPFLERTFPYVVLQYFIMVPLKLESSI